MWLTLADNICVTHIAIKIIMACFCDTERGQACCEMITSNKSLLKLLFSYMAHSQDNSIIKLLLPLNHSPIFNPFVKQDKHHWVIKNNYASGLLIHVSLTKLFHLIPKSWLLSWQNNVHAPWLTGAWLLWLNRKLTVQMTLDSRWI